MIADHVVPETAIALYPSFAVSAKDDVMMQSAYLEVLQPAGPEAPVVANHDDHALGSALDGLRDDLISLYVVAEKIHWHLRMNVDECKSLAAMSEPAEFARELSGHILNAILRTTCVRDGVLGQQGCCTLRKVLRGMQDENAALAAPAAMD